MGSLKNLKSLASDSVIYGMAGVLTRFLGVLLTPLYTRVYHPEDYGIFGILNNGYALITIVLILALDNSTARWFYDTKDRDFRKSIINSWLWFYLLFSLIIGIFFFLTSNFWSRLIFENNPETADYIRLLSFNLPVVVLTVVATKVLRFEKKAKETVFLTLLQGVLLILLNVLYVLYLQQGLKGAFVAKLITSIALVPVSIYMIRSWIGTIRFFNLGILKQMIRYSLPFLPAGLAIWVINLSAVFFLNGYVSKEEIGLFQIGFAIASFAGLFTSSFQQAWMPFAYSIMEDDDAKQTYAKVLLVYILVVGFGTMLISVFSLEALMIIATPSYYGAATVASILTFSTLFLGLTSIADLGSSIAKKTAPLGIIYSLSAGVLIVLNLILIPIWGKEGAAMAICLSQLITPILVFKISQKYYFIPYDFKRAVLIFNLMVIVALGGSAIHMDSWVYTVLLKSLLIISFLAILAFFLRKEIQTIIDQIRYKLIKRAI